MASTIFTLALAPTRLAPAAAMVFKSSRVRTPPEAFTPIAGPTVRRISATSSAVAPPGPKPVEVFTKSAPASFANRDAATFCCAVCRRVLHDGVDIGAHPCVIPAAQRSYMQHHVDFLCSVANGRGGFGNLDFRGTRAQRKADDRAHLHRRTRQLACNQTNPVRIHTDAREAVVARFRAHFANVGCSGFRFQQSVVDESCDRRIKSRHRTDRSIGGFSPTFGILGGWKPYYRPRLSL